MKLPSQGYKADQTKVYTLPQDLQNHLKNKKVQTKVEDCQLIEMKN
jgi:hypothetical protein